MLFQIKGRFDGLVKCEVEITCAHNANEATRLGKAAITAISQGANLGGANLGGADLRGANLCGTDLGGANLRSADLRGANLRGADLCGANLDGANLRGADLGVADLRVADLRVADLRGANLRGADLCGADLRVADLCGADLRGADLRGADLGGAVSKVIKLVSAIQRSDSYTFFGFAKETGELGIVAGCQNRVLSSYREHVAKDYVGRSNAVALIAETTDILDFLEKRHAVMVKP